MQHHRPVEHPGWASALTTCLLMVSAAMAQEAPSAEASQNPQAALSVPAIQLHWGGGWLRYSEPHMRLEGPMARLQWRTLQNHSVWPDVLVADVAAADLRYNSQSTGTIHHVPGLSSRISGLWNLDANAASPLLAGLQLELDWTDMRGTSSTGHKGYRRQGSKAWMVMQYPNVVWGTLQAGALLMGRQLSQLSDIPGNRIPDIINSQKQGWFANYTRILDKDSMLPGWQASVRYSLVQSSDKIGHQGWYEPRNQTWLLSLQKPW